MARISAQLHGQQGDFSLDVDLSLPGDGCSGIFGPSGCGKTTILRCIAGLERFKGSQLSVGGKIWQDERTFLAPHKRPIGYVFQAPQLFPHLSVAGNLRYAMRRVGAAADGPLSFKNVCALMGIEKFLDRRPQGLSGGEQQRVAIARALLTRPQLLLMDEPLSALDRASRREILPYLESLHQRLQLPVIYVTHDFSEIERLADHLVLMEPGGKIRAAGPLSELQTDLSLPIAEESDAATVLKVVIRSYDAGYDLTACAIDGLALQVPGHIGAPGEGRRLSVRAADVSFVRGPKPESSTLLNILPAHIVRARAIGKAKMLVLLRIDCHPKGVDLMASVTRKSWDTLKFKAGEAVFAQVKSMALANPGCDS